MPNSTTGLPNPLLDPAPGAATFGGFLRQLRRRAGLTQRELAAVVGFSISQISLLEKDQRLPDLLLVGEKFAPALGLADEPHLLHRLLHLAAAARGERPPDAIHVQRTVHVQAAVHEEWVEEDALLPAALTPLLARRHEIDQAVARLLAAPGRLLTLIGPPGVGKTRLALAVAEQMQPLLADGAALVTLDAVRGPDVFAGALAAALHVREGGGRTPQQRLIDHLRPKELLLVLDDFEHLLAAPPALPPLPASAEAGAEAGPAADRAADGAPLPARTESARLENPRLENPRPESARPESAAGLLLRLLASCPRLRLLVTSREPLRVRAEQRLRVQPLPPAAAVELFLRRAEAVEPDFAPTPADLRAIAELCLRLDCLPLAIELVAARIDLLSPPAMLARLLDQRLDLLEGGPGDLPAHQSTLRRAIERSYALLDAGERQLLRACAVFAGSFDLAALAGCVTPPGPAAPGAMGRLAAVESGVQSLVVKSLVKTVTLEGGERRYVLLETLRAYAAEQLAAAGEEEGVRERHARYYAAFALGQRPAGMPAAAAPATPAAPDLAALGREHANLLLALQWCVRHDPPAALRLAAALRDFWYRRGLFEEGRRWTQAALDAADAAEAAGATQAGGTPAERAAALLALGQMLLNQNEANAAQAALAEAVASLRRLRDEAGCARALIELGWAVYLNREEQASAACFAESLALAQRLEDDALAAHALTSLTHVLVYEGAYTPQLRAYIEESVTLYRRLHDAHGLAQALLNLCTFFVQTGDPAAALLAGREAQQVAVAAGLATTQAWACSTLGELLMAGAGGWEEAGAQLAAALRLFQEAGQREGVYIVQHHLGDLARRRGQWEEAAAFFAASHAAAAASDDRRMMARCFIGEAQLALARGAGDQARHCLAAAQALLAALPAFLSAAALAELRAAEEAAAAV